MSTSPLTRPSTRPAGRRRLSAALVGALAVPTLVAAVAVVSTGDRIEGARSLPAAVVNLDEPVTVGEGKDASPIAAGRLLAAGLTRPEAATDASTDAGADPGMAWTLADADTASAGLADGTFHAVVTIPENFSATVAKISGDTPEQAGVSVRTDGADATVVGTITTDVAEVAADSLGRTITTTYLKGLYAKTSELGEQIGEAADGADQLTDGAGQLRDGLSALDGGAGELADGAGRAASGAETLAGGARTLDDGAGQLASGSSQLSTGTSKLKGGLGDLASGAKELSGGAAGVSAGAAKVDTGAQELAKGLGTLKSSTTDLSTQSTKLADGSEQVSEGVAGWAQVLRGWGQACENPLLAGAAAQLCAGTALALGDGGANADALVAGSAQVAEGNRTLAEASPQLRAGIVAAADGADQLAEGTAALNTGSSTLAGGAAKLSTGASSAKSAAKKLDRGTTRLAQGAGQLAEGTGSLSGGADQLAEGTSTLASGSTELRSGAGKLLDGADQLDEGSSTLAEGLRKGAEAVPSTTPKEQEANAAAVARPVVATTDDDSPTAARTGVLGSAAALALWLGAFATFLALPALSRARLAAAGTARSAVTASLLPALALAVGQVALVLGAVRLLDLDVTRPWMLALVALPATALAAVAVAQAVIALCGERLGPVLVLALTAVQALALPGFLPLDAAPGWVQDANGLLPVGLGADLLGWSATGTGGAGSLAGLLLWAVAGVLVSVWAASRRRRVTLAAVRRQVAVPA